MTPARVQPYECLEPGRDNMLDRPRGHFLPMLAPREDLLPLRPLVARLAVPLATYAAMRTYAGLEADPNAAAEGIFLALFSGALLFAVALLPGLAFELGAGSLLATAALWSLPPGPARGTAISIILTATLVVAALRRLPEAGRQGKLPLRLAISLSLGAQVLLRGHLLFAPERNPKTLFALFVLPLAGALAVWWAARRHGVGPAACAAALTLTLAPGWNVSSLLGWIGFVAGESLVRKETPRGERWTALLLGLGIVARFGLSGAAFLVCGTALAMPLPALGAAAALALAFSWPAGPAAFAGAWPRLFWCLLLVPSLLLPQRERRPAALAALLLAVALPLAPNPGVLAAPVALAVFAASTRPGIAQPRHAWAAILFAASALLASYPWLRPTPLPAALRLFGLSPGWLPFLLLAVAVGRPHRDLGVEVIGVSTDTKFSHLAWRNSENTRRRLARSVSIHSSRRRGAVRSGTTSSSAHAWSVATDMP